MGILDDAIREHLELKRQHGAESDDLERLEKEAFGAPARPGDPEFATGEEPAVAEAGEAPTVAEVALPAAEEEPAAEQPAEPAPEGNTDDWLAAGDETTVAPEEPRVEPSPAERARAEAPPAPTEPLPPPAESAEEPPEAPERGIFDAAEEFEFDDDLDLDLDEEDDGTVNPQSAAPEAPAVPDEPREPLPPEQATEVQPAPYVEDDTDNPPLPVQPRRPAGEDEEGEDEEGEDEEGEDLLEETPDFLQEQPEGEDLWFEQGPPKDFDFDDDD